MTHEPLLSVKDLRIYFGLGHAGVKTENAIKAVDGVSFTINKGETLGLVGESGSGKTTVGRAILRAIEPTGGKVTLTIDGKPIPVSSLSRSELKGVRSHMQLIFQDPYASLNPRMTVRDIIAEPLECQNYGSREEIDERVRQIAISCKLNVEHLRRFPHAFSGGQRQRIGIARALVANPQFIVCDESVSALDVSIQAEIVNLLMDMQEELGLTYLFIAHDLSVVAQIATNVAVMYVGQLCELAPTYELFHSPKHPYTKAILSAIPGVDPNQKFAPVRLDGEIPNPANLPPGCRFSTRCSYVQERCKHEQPAWREIASHHMVACHFAEKLDAGDPVENARAKPQPQC
ncbi:MAG: peptide ABC transporter ATP-binding protein [Acidiferrobacteraceae bacterium]|jgi:peptide/nickel transport system ATP-binding protein|nr:peptide ABC transporter ATP-binding protein [Acidiferrobacteraceae bacterium]|tara:strand:- start:225 stop:1262 length:1038 start_codon:yes stop_codon:yes gene_type:complete